MSFGIVLCLYTSLLVDVYLSTWCLFYRLWVHCACLYFVSFYGLYLLHKVAFPSAFYVHSLFRAFWLIIRPNKLRKSIVWICFFHLSQEYEDILVKRIQQLHLMRHEPNQLTVLVREIPFCEEHNAHDCAVDHFFSKYHPHSYQSYQILYDGRELDKLMVRLL